MGSVHSLITAYFAAPGEAPERALATWRATPPGWLPKRYQEIEDSYNSVTWEWRHTQALMRLVTFGGLLGGQTCYRLTALFEDDGHGGALITVDGAADEDTRAAIGQAADRYVAGGTV